MSVLGGLTKGIVVVLWVRITEIQISQELFCNLSHKIKFGLCRATHVALLSFNCNDFCYERQFNLFLSLYL